MRMATRTAGLMTTLTCFAALSGLALTLSGCDEGSSAGSTAAPQPAANVTEVSENRPAATDQAEAPDADEAEPRLMNTDPFTAPDEPLPPDRQTGPGPQITFAKARHDFGQISDIREHRTSFPFRNTGTETLRIEDVKASCGCTALELEKRVFEPGEGDWIRVAFTPKGHGKQAKDITVISNAGNASTQRLIIAADIVPLLTIEPSQYLRFGTVDIREDHTRYVDIVGRYPDVIIDSVNAPNTLISARVVAEDGQTDVYLPTEPGKRHRIAVTLHRNGRWGGFYSVVNVHTRSVHPETGEQIPHNSSIHVSANVFGEIHASDTMFRIGATPPRTPFKRVITMTRPNGQPWTLTGAYIENARMPGLQLQVDPINQPNIAGYRITISGDPGPYLGAVGGRVRIMTDVPGEEEFLIPIAGIVREM